MRMIWAAALLAAKRLHSCHPPSRPASRARLATLPAGHRRQSARPRRVSRPLILHPRAHSSLAHRLDCSRCRIGSRDPSAGGSARLMALGHRALRPQARPMVRPPICHASPPPAGTHCPLSRTSARPLPLAPLTARLRLLQGSSLQPFQLRASFQVLSSSPIQAARAGSGFVGAGDRRRSDFEIFVCMHVDGPGRLVVRACSLRCW